MNITVNIYRLSYLDHDHVYILTKYAINVNHMVESMDGILTSVNWFEHILLQCILQWD